MAATQHAQLKAQLPQLTELSQLMAGITACCANLPATLMSDAAYTPTRCALDKLASGSAGDSEMDKKKPKCKLGHTMEQRAYQLGPYAQGWFCDGCNGNNSSATMRWMCMACLQISGQGVDYCFACHPAY